MTATLSQLLALPSLRDASVVAGPAQVPVRDVTGLPGTPREVSRLLAGDRASVIVLLNPVGYFDTQFDVLLRRCGQAGVTAVVFAAAEAEPGTGTVALAEHLGLTLVTVLDPWRASVVLHEQLSDASAPAARLTRLVAEAALDAGPGVAETLAALEAVIGYRLLLLSPTGQPVVGDIRLSRQARDMLSTSAATGRPVTVPLEGEEQLVAAPVGTGIGKRTWLGTRIPRGLPAESLAVTSALQTASIAVGHRLALARLVDERDARYRSALLDELRTAGQAVPPSLAQRAIAAGWRLDAWHIGIRIQARSEVDPIALRGDVDAAFAAHGVAVDLVEQDDGWAAWTSHDAEPPVTEVQDLATRVRRAQAALDRQLATNIGVGSLQAGPAGLIRSIGEAADAARLANNRPETGHFLHIDKLGLAQLLLAWTQTDTFLPAARELLAPLDRSGGQLRSTLATYLDSGASVNETAAILGLHRNTIANRVAQIQRLLGVDLADPETRLALHLATRTLAPHRAGGPAA
ncbi:MAG TPA: helix-turn-helix domain-containing protein [Trebonia sp.]|nr:helix-turn-helix domain-containing protein [Trebonia sp.]